MVGVLGMKWTITPERAAHRTAKRLELLARRRWKGMLQRCYDAKHHKYEHYGARGIVVCAAWMDFATFYRDIGDAPVGMSMDRVDNNGNYEPSNVRWATVTQQRNNQRGPGGRRPGVQNKIPRKDQSVHVFSNGKEITLQAAADSLGIKRKALIVRLKRMKINNPSGVFQLDNLKK